MKPTWLGRVDYASAHRMQRAHREAVIAGRAKNALWMLEHDPVITTGRRVAADVPSQRQLVPHGIRLVSTERGGLATYHGPGQLVGYLIADIQSVGQTVKGTVWAVEQGVIDWLRSMGVDAGRRSEYPGVWVGTDKICAVGMHFRRGVSMHGFALNLTTDLGDFRHITPCGITDGGVTSMSVVAGTSLDPGGVFLPVGEAVLRRFVDTSSARR